jgi:hypothetical protein
MKVTILPSEIGLEDTDIGIDIKPTVNVEIVNSNKKTIEFEMNMRKALNGDLMIFEHKEIDIVIMEGKKKVVAFAKGLMSEVVYGAEARLMEHLRQAGIIEYDSIQGGNVYGSLEGKIHDSPDRNNIKASIYQIYEWCLSEKPYLEAKNSHDNAIKNHLIDPTDEFSTELGEVPHEDEKGSINQKGMFSPYYYGRFTY